MSTSFESIFSKENQESKPLTAIERHLYLREKVPTDVESRVKPLKDLEDDIQQMIDEYSHELYDLERKYHEDYETLYAKREAIIKGEYEPIDEIKPLWTKKDKEVDLAKYIDFFEASQNLPEYYNGIPNFWLHIFTTCDTLSQLIYEDDIDALQYLNNVHIDYNIDSFILEFHFDDNPYFFNNILTKEYFLKNTIDKDNPCGYEEGFRIYKCRGCTIHWKPDMNLTVKLIYKQNGRVRLRPIDSFFNFFNPPNDEIDPPLQDIDEKTYEILMLDFKIGNFIREEIIPKAILYFIGELIDDKDANDDDVDGDDKDDICDIDDDDEYAVAIVRDDEKHVANVARVLRKINWS